MIFDYDGSTFDTDEMHTFSLSSNNHMLLVAFTRGFTDGFVAMYYPHEGVHMERVHDSHLRRVEADNENPQLAWAIRAYRAQSTIAA